MPFYASTTVRRNWSLMFDTINIIPARNALPARFSSRLRQLPPFVDGGGAVHAERRGKKPIYMN
jgi:hypothetical protein